MDKQMWVEVPNRFWDDHQDRGGSPTAIIVRRKSRTTIVLLDAAALADIESDAIYYADDATADGDRRLIGLAASARATLRAIGRAR